mmetsp:Transcript_15167/g.20591  ORF Transcript_15167/g.20591 Transcript_15167/m.20591 type:complete len:81 (-) Transcript_15167:1822-2064(-)
MDLGDLNMFKRTKTMAGGRGSIFIPKKAKGRNIDFSGASPDPHQSDDEERELKRNTSQDSMEGGKYSLKQYNRERKARLA